MFTRKLPIVAAALCLAAAVLIPSMAAGGVPGASTVTSKTFKLFPNPAFLACAQATGHTATASATVTRGAVNDTLKLSLAGFKPNLGFDLFTVQRSNQTAAGTPVAG